MLTQAGSTHEPTDLAQFVVPIRRSLLHQPLTFVKPQTDLCLLQPAAGFTEFSGLKNANALRCGRQEQTLASRVATQATTVRLEHCRAPVE